MRGFTLIELIATTAIVATMLTVGVPSFKNLLENHHAKISLFTLRQTLQKARIFALKKGQKTLVCPIKNKQCVDDWSQPLAVFSDLNNNLTLDANEDLLVKVSNNVAYGYWQKKKATQSYIKFNNLGHAFGSATTFLYCPNSGSNNFAKQLVINFQGRIRTNSYLNTLGTPYSNVTPLICP